MKYRLLKDTIKDDGIKNYVVPKGTIFINGNFGKYLSDDEHLWSFTVSFVENNTEWFEKVIEGYYPILSVTDNDGHYYLIINKEDMAMYENTEKGKLQNGYFGYIENGVFRPSQRRKDKTCIINYAKEDNYVFNHKRIKDRIDDLKELENAFNAARKQSDEVIGRGEYHSGDCSDLHKNLFRDFNDYMASLTSI